MPNPKRRHSATRRDKRRTHDKAKVPTLSIDQTTGLPHLRHHAHYSEGELYYKGKKILSKESE
jgi:large subunit ribosomal protein L32